MRIITRQSLLAQAKALKIRGRWDMTVPQLQEALLKINAVKPVPQKSKASMRAGSNWSENPPYVGIVYRCRQVVNREALASEPKQVRQLIEFMAESKVEGRGEQIISAAIRAGAIKTKIKDHRTLFGYYAKKLRYYGAEHEYEVSGYNKRSQA